MELKFVNTSTVITETDEKYIYYTISCNLTKQQIYSSGFDDYDIEQ